MPQTFFDLNLLANMVAKFDMFANNISLFGHTLIAMKISSSYREFHKINTKAIRATVKFSLSLHLTIRQTICYIRTSKALSVAL